MRILYVCHRFPFPPKRGGKIRPFNMISHLSQQHDVHVVSLARSEQEAKEGQGISEHCKQYFACKISNNIAWLKTLIFGGTLIPASFGYFHSFAMKKKIRELINQYQFDLIFVHCSSVAHYVADIEGIPKILDFGDMDSQKWLDYSIFKPFPLSWIYKLEGIKLERVEKQLARKFDYSSCTTRAEHNTLVSYKETQNTFWFPNGVDTTYFRTQEQYDCNQICFIGRMDYYPNQEGMFEFCEKVWSRLLAEKPELKLVIVGADPSDKVRALENLQNVTVTGSVPDVRPYVLDSALSIAPLNIARGTQNKILESMAMGVPVICSQQAAGGIDAEEDSHMLVARDADEYVCKILEITANEDKRQQFSEAGRQRVLTNHNWNHSMRRLDELIECCTNDYGIHKLNNTTVSVQK